ncbi:MAG: hypothetical protein AB7N24_13175 [Dehalococcoidia bacterium]
MSLRSKTLCFGLSSILAAVLAVASIAIVSANASTSSTGGCTALGSTWIDSPDYAWSATNSSPYGGCGWVYSLATFYSGGFGYNRGPGWANSSYAIGEFFNSTTSAAGTHNLCDAGGPCLSSVPWNTSDVP